PRCWTPAVYPCRDRHREGATCIPATQESGLGCSPRAVATSAETRWTSVSPAATINVPCHRSHPTPCSGVLTLTEQTPSRRGFPKKGAATLAILGSAAHVHAAGNDTIRVGLIGCGSPRGGRGRGAAENCVSAGPGVKLVAMADLFKEHLDYTLEYLSKKHGKDKVDVPEGRRYVGWDAYQRLVEDRDIDLVILASPPGFRPGHLEAAVKAGKHVFAE